MNMPKTLVLPVPRLGTPVQRLVSHVMVEQEGYTETDQDDGKFLSTYARVTSTLKGLVITPIRILYAEGYRHYCGREDL